MKEIKWDLLQPQDIEVRVGNKIKDTDNVAMLLYQDSRCTARNLDKQFGSFGWQIDYKVVGEQIYGTLSIYDEEKQQWISKSDTGDKSNISEEKGQSSDILKRCAVRWGFGVELYSAPKIVIPNDGYGNSGYKVSEINYNENREIINLVIVNRFNKEVFRWNINQKPSVNNNKPNIPTIDKLELSSEQVKGNFVGYINNVPEKTNKEKLNEFYLSIKDNPTTNLNELNKFYNYYSTKDFKGNINCIKLWSGWLSRVRS